jgi:retron-type reverse transcriptase
MKRARNLWSCVTSYENLLAAAEAAARGKRFRPDVAAFDARREEEVARLRAELLGGSYRPGPYRDWLLREGKPRVISAAPFRDRVVHHALCRVLEPLWERRFIPDSYACRPGKGTHAAADRYQVFSRRAPYVLQCDIRKYFPSIDHTILWEETARVVGDREILDLVALILRTRGDGGSSGRPGRGFPSATRRASSSRTSTSTVSTTG